MTTRLPPLKVHYLKKGVTITPLGVSVPLFRNNMPWSVVATTHGV